MRAAYFRGDGVIDIVDVPTPTPGEGQLLIKVAANGVCGSDRKILQGGFNLIPGHEVAGTVVRRVARGVERGVARRLRRCLREVDRRVEGDRSASALRIGAARRCGEKEHHGERAHSRSIHNAETRHETL